jgi:hypothetical protein
MKDGKSLEAPSKNLSVYRKRHVLKVWFGTGETLSCTGNRKEEAYKQKCEIVLL